MPRKWSKKDSCYLSVVVGKDDYAELDRIRIKLFGTKGKMPDLLRTALRNLVRQESTPGVSDK